MSEANLQKRCLDELERLGHACTNIHQGGWTGKGFPDIIACIDGKFVAFETKVGRYKQSPSQRIWQKRIERSGGKYFLPYTFEEFLQNLREV